jgi:hypothetical protein
MCVLEDWTERESPIWGQNQWTGCFSENGRR